MHKFLMAALLLITPMTLLAQSVEVDDSGSSSAPAPADSGKSGKSEANKYFQFRRTGNRPAPKDSASDKGAKVTDAKPHFLSVHVGTYFTDQTYSWGTNDQKNVTNFLTAGVTYRIGEWVNVADVSLRAEYTGYVLDNGQAKEISISPIITFPDSNSRFPLYFGAGVGPGLFVQQTHGVSPLSLDFQILGGVRLLDLVEHVGFMFEVGWKNSLLLASPGQFNGVFVNLGAAFAF